MLKPLWGKQLPLKIRKDATHKELLESGLSKWKIFNKAMIEDDENYMLYDDGSEALFMPGQTQDFFVLSKYREELGETSAELSISCVLKRITREITCTMRWAKIQIIPVIHL